VQRDYCEALDLPKNDGPIFADIWFCNRHILKAKLTALSSVKDFRIPYYVFAPFRIDDTMFGASIAYLCRDSQRTADAAWLMGLHNLSVSAGPQIVIRKGKVQPADGKYSIRGPKIWYVTDDSVNVGDVFDSINIQNNFAQANDCFQQAKMLMDEELNTVQWASPDTSDVTETASGLAMLMNARTILQRRVSACADDDVFLPMIQRFVLWNMLYNEREDIKGDFDVRPLCQSVRLVKDIRIQQKLFVADNLAQNPLFQSIFSPYDMIADITRDMDIHVDNWLKPKQQWMQEQQQAQQQDPHAMLAQANAHLAYAKTLTEQAHAAKLHAEAIALPSQAQVDESGQQSQFVSPDMQAKMQMHSIDNQTELMRANTEATAQQQDAHVKIVQAAMNLQGKREQIAATQSAAMTRMRHDLVKQGQDHAHQLEVAKFKAATKAPSVPRPKGSFKAPATPKYRGGKR
jgi:hypothetical protein